MPYIIPKADALSPSSSTCSTPTVSSPSRELPKDVCIPRIPLKPALKIRRSLSTGEYDAEPPQTPPPPFVREARQRAQSAPVVAQCAAESSSTATSSLSIPISSPTKTVRWPSDDTSLEKVRLFRKHGKPIHVSHPGDDTGTETEGESSASAVSGFRYEALAGFGYPTPPRDRRVYPSTRFPKTPLSSIQTLVGSVPVLVLPLAKEGASSGMDGGETPYYEVDEGVSSPIPSRSFDAASNVHLESLKCASTTELQTTLEGTVLVRNISYSKEVTCRFTLDEWATTSNVSAQYVETLPSFPFSYFPPQNHPTTIGDAAGLLSLVDQIGAEWDRFRFTIVVDHGVYELGKKTMWLAVRFAVDGGEWWDNNGGGNYKIGFRLAAKRQVLSESPVVMTSEEAGKGARGTQGTRPSQTTARQAGVREDGSRRPISYPTSSYIPHTSHALLPIQPRGASPTSSPTASHRYSSHSPLAYPMSAPLPELKVRPEWKRESWALGGVQVTSIMSGRVSA